MDEQSQCMHYVCTHEEAWQLVKDRNQFWVSNCGCREQHGNCVRSRMDLCLDFNENISSGGSGTKKVALAEVEEIFREARDKHLVTRPFRDTEKNSETIGICFCCDDCCGYFLDPNEKCDKGKFLEKTDSDKCTNCGECVEVCFFGARRMENGGFILIEDNCYGCGLCTDVCPESCIEMVQKN